MKTIKKAKLNSVSYLEVEFTEKVISDQNETFSFEAEQKCTWSPHNDLLVLLDALKPHLACLCEQVSIEDLDKQESHPILTKLKVTGFTIGGQDEHEGVTLIGRRVLAHNRVLNLISPFTKWEDEHNGYARSYEMASIIQQLQDEVVSYLNGKKAPNAQTELDFENVSNNQLVEAE